VRPKLVPIGNNQYVVLWEHWRSEEVENQWGWSEWQGDFYGVYGMVIDENGDVIAPATLLTEDAHLHRGDDAFTYDGQAGWMTGDRESRELHLHLVGADLSYQRIVID